MRGRSDFSAQNEASARVRVVAVGEHIAASAGLTVNAMSTEREATLNKLDQTA